MAGIAIAAQTSPVEESLAYILAFHRTRFTFTPEAEEWLAHRIRGGITVMHGAGLLYDHQAGLRASISLYKLMATAVVEARIRGHGNITQDLLEEVLKRICPVWPFCGAYKPPR